MKAKFSVSEEGGSKYRDDVLPNWPLFHSHGRLAMRNSS